MNLYDFKVKNMNEEVVSLGEYKGKVVVVVNTATKCGLTGQYEQLQDVYAQYSDKGFEVLDFPCNQFLEQSPGSNAEINEFCTLNFATKFSRFAKVDVNGENADSLFVWLKEQAPVDIENEGTKAFEAKVREFTGDIADSDIKWNFGKFLIDREGNVVARFSPTVTPKEMEAKILEVL